MKKPAKDKVEEEEEQSSEDSDSDEDDDTSELGSIPDPVASSKYQVHTVQCVYWGCVGCNDDVMKV